ncbi:unnamed protein product [marine sediment metagenome]|uniref:Carbon storage regulator n=1 Tax=marine sediment metagenome TaxID=412755 RepID=X0TGB7_9ZZZZ
MILLIDAQLLGIAFSFLFPRREYIMLVLTRKFGESIRINHMGETLELRIVKLHGSSCRLGFDGSKTFQILRRELPPRPRSGVNAKAAVVKFPHGKPAAPPAEAVG